MRTPPPRLLALGLVLVAGILAACSDSPQTPPIGAAQTTNDPQYSVVKLCKKEGVPDTWYKFDIRVNGIFTQSVNLQPGDALNEPNCTEVYRSLDGAKVDILEDLSGGAQLDWIGVNTSPGASVTTNGAQVTFTLAAGSSGLAEYHNKNVAFVCTDENADNFGGPLPCTYTTPCPAGSFTFNFLQNGDLAIKYDQFPAPNDNSYGINAVGWPNGHKFSDLVGSDHAGIQLIDGTGTVRLSFNVDYLTANSAAPSGYASLGVTGGDGKMLVGTADGITATTSLANNLNNINIPGLFVAHVQQFGSVNVLINSPPTDPAHSTYDISDPLLAGWDFHDTYYVTISAAKLASIGFNAATWQVVPNLSQLHNSPAKACPPTTGDGLSITKYEVKDKQVKVTILNSASTDAFLTALTLDWPSLVNGKLMQIKLDGDVIYSGPSITNGPISLTTAELVSDQNKRKINHGSSDVYTLVFEKNADTNLTHYAGTVTISGTTLTVLPPSP